MKDLYVDCDDKNADWLHSLKRTAKKVLKSKIYLKPGEKPPKAYEVKRGPRGGQYYETDIKLKLPTEPAKVSVPPFKVDINMRDHPDLSQSKLFQGFLFNLKEAKDLSSQFETLSTYKAEFESYYKKTNPELYNKIQKIHRVLYRHAKYVARQHELAKLGKAHIDMRIFQHKIKIFEKVKDTGESLDHVSTVKTSANLSTGCNVTQKIQFSNDVIINAIFKPLSGESIGLHAGVKTLYNREVCAYELDQLFGLNLVPETVYKTIDEKIGSAQKWISGTKISDDVKRKDIFSNEILKLILFDYLISNTDRHNANFLLKKDSKIDKYYIIAIDNGGSFSTSRYDEYNYMKRTFLEETREYAKIPGATEVVKKFTSVPWSKIQKVLIKHKIPTQAINICQDKFELLKDLDHFPTYGEVKTQVEPVF